MADKDRYIVKPVPRYREGALFTHMVVDTKKRVAVQYERSEEGAQKAADIRNGKAK